MHWNRASSDSEGEVSWFFLSGAGTWGILLSYGRDDSPKLVFVQRCQVSCLITRDTSRISSRKWQGNMDASRGEARDPGYLSSCYSDIGISINFQQESGIVKFNIDLHVPLDVSK